MLDMEEKCLNNLENLIAGLHDGAGAEDLISSRVPELYESIAERPFPLPFIFTGRPPFKRLLWRPEDFRPEIREILDRELSAEWRGIGHVSEASEEAPPHEDAPAKEAAEDGATGDREPAVAAPGISETTPDARPGPAAFSTVAVKEDLFDRFVGWVAALVS